MLKALFIVLLFALPSFANELPVQSSFADQIRFPVTKIKLENGMTVLLHEDHSTPMVSIHQWYRVGSRNEKPGMTGISHFFEHLMFKGTEKYSQADFEGLIQANGGTNNAFTTYDYTGYYVDIVSGKLDLILDMESDRMANLLFTEEAIKSEREVVKEERRYRTENNINGVLNEAVYKTVFKVHPYRWPVIGSMRDLNNTSTEQLKDYYRTYYSPNNSVLVIVGDFKTAEVTKLVKKYYSKIPAQEIPELNVAQEPQQRAPRQLTLKKDVQSRTFAVAYKSVRAGDEDQYAFDLLSNILSEGNSSRLHHRLVYQEQLMNQVDAWAYTPKDPGVFEIYGTMKRKASLSRALGSIESELAKLRKELVSEKELEKAKNQVMMSYVDSLKTISGKARAIAVNEILFGDYQELFKDIDRYMQVTPEQIQKVAKTYLTPQQKSVVKILPKRM